MNKFDSSLQITINLLEQQYNKLKALLPSNNSHSTSIQTELLNNGDAWLYSLKSSFTEKQSLAIKRLKRRQKWMKTYKKLMVQYEKHRLKLEEYFIDSSAIQQKLDIDYDLPQKYKIRIDSIKHFYAEICSIKDLLPSDYINDLDCSKCSEMITEVEERRVKYENIQRKIYQLDSNIHRLLEQIKTWQNQVDHIVSK